jgi:hypothetical protein
MLSKKFGETEVKMMFAPFGNIEDCTVLRDQNGQSRGKGASKHHWHNCFDCEFYSEILFCILELL